MRITKRLVGRASKTQQLTTTATRSLGRGHVSPGTAHFQTAWRGTRTARHQAPQKSHMLQTSPGKTVIVARRISSSGTHLIARCLTPYRLPVMQLSLGGWTPSSDATPVQRHSLVFAHFYQVPPLKSWLPYIKWLNPNIILIHFYNTIVLTLLRFLIFRILVVCILKIQTYTSTMPISKSHAGLGLVLIVSS